MMEDLCADAQCLGKIMSGHWLDHEFLNIHIVIGVLTAVEYVHHRYRHRQRRAVRQLRNMLIKRLPERLGCRLGGRQRHRQYRISTKLGFVVSAISLNHPLVNGLLITRITAEQQATNRAVHMPNCSKDAFTEISLGVSVSQL